MNGRAYYNEFDPKAAEWLRELIKGGHIAPGEVDERSIADVRSDDLRGFAQCHFFAGIGGWSYALRLAAWADDRPVWTGSCPCQPFSAAGLRLGTADARHLWPVWFDLIAECRPPVIFGEQVCSMEVIAGKQGKGRGISEEVSFALPSEVAREVSKAAGARKGHPVQLERPLRGNSEAHRLGHMRDFWTPVQPSWWEDVGQPIARQDRPDKGVHLPEHQGRVPCGEQRARGLGRGKNVDDRPFDHGAANSALQRALRNARKEFDEAIGGAWSAGVRADLEAAGYAVGACDIPSAGVGSPNIRQRLYWLADSNGKQAITADTRGLHAESGGGGINGGQVAARSAGREGREKSGSRQKNGQAYGASPALQDSPWSRYDLLSCTDGKSRRVESGSFPLVARLPGRVGLLRGYGNAINPWVAKEFIEAYSNHLLPAGNHLLAAGA